MDTLNDAQIQDALGRLDGWERDGDAITRTWQLDDFATAVRFMNRIFELADEAGHHPDLHNSFTTVTVSLTTHSEGAITAKDVELAERIDAAHP